MVFRYPGAVQRLPSLNAVRAFEAAARHLSISKAAEELNVTAGAVSRQIQQLEAFLGTELLTRAHRQVTLTRAGKDVALAAGQAIDLIRDATQRVTKRAQRKRLKVRAYTTFAMRWLIPRLSSFQSAHPDFEVLLTASLEPVDFRKEDLDAAIRLGDGQWPGCRSDRLVANILTPVCSPRLVKSGPPLKTPADLAHHTLLHSIARPDDWAHWLENVGSARKVDARAGMSYESSAMAYAAAIEGQGIANAQRFLVEEDLRARRLVRPFRQEVDMGDFTYYLVVPRSRPESGPTRLFRSWLLEQFGQGSTASGG
jgi:LysR family glycine cleavage system transcriptional activator